MKTLFILIESNRGGLWCSSMAKDLNRHEVLIDLYRKKSVSNELSYDESSLDIDGFIGQNYSFGLLENASDFCHYSE